MGRRAKPAKVKAKANRPPARTSRKDEGIKVRDREKRLAEALQREAAAAKREAEALEQQAATSKILELISSARTDVTPVFDAIAENAVRLCDASLGALLRFDGQMIHLAAHAHQDADSLQALQTMYPMPASRAGVSGRALLEGTAVHVRDMREDSELARAPTAQVGHRTVLSVPMMRGGAPIGAITVARPRVEPFSERQIDLLQTFADQAVIAIENARLLSELQARTRELEVASEHKSEFLANMSHELRTPLNSIIGFSEVMLERIFGDINEKQEEYLNDVLTSGRHLLSLINDILDLSKIEAGKMELDLTDFDLPAALDNALTLIRERATRRGQLLNRVVDPTVGPIRGDERKVKQVLLNLLSNAVKFTPEGGRITVAAGLANGFAQISVTDTGVGIAPEDHDAVFEEFRQVGKAEKKAEGTGLGLALCRRFVELHGGRIWVKSQHGAGSTFTFTLPLSR